MKGCKTKVQKSRQTFTKEFQQVLRQQTLKKFVTNGCINLFVRERQRDVSGTMWHKVTGGLALNTHQHSTPMRGQVCSESGRKSNKDRK